MPPGPSELRRLNYAGCRASSGLRLARLTGLAGQRQRRQLPGIIVCDLFSLSQRLIIILLTVASLAIADNPEKVILDTDSGPFNDDGVALVMLLQSASKMSLQGITVVPGNVWPLQGAEYMLAHTVMMRHSDIPVFTGATTPLLHTPAIAAAAAEKFGKQNYIGAFAEQPARTRADLKKPFYWF